MRKLILFACAAAVTAAAVAQSEPTVYVKANADVSEALTAAIVRKHVPVVVVADAARAQYVLQAAPLASKNESGAGKIARCMFADCIGINGSSTLAVELIRESDGAIVWAYQVRKALSGPAAVQSLSEAVAKHLKKDYLDKHSG